MYLFFKFNINGNF